MTTYKANANALGLTTGETFDSDDQFYADIAKSGIIEEVKGDGESSTGNADVPSAEGNAPSGGGDSPVGSRAKGRDKGQGTLS